MFINRNTAHWSHSDDLFIYFHLTHITHWSVSLEWRHNSIVQHNIFTWFVRIWSVRIRTQDNSQLITTLGHYIADNCRLWHASVRINRIKMCKWGKRAWNRLWKRFDYECLLLFFLFKHLTSVRTLLPLIFLTFQCGVEFRISLFSFALKHFGVCHRKKRQAKCVF